MKIIIEYAGGASTWVRNSWRKVFEASGHTVFMWNKEHENINDLEVRTGPVDIFLSNTYSVDRAVDRFIRRHPEMKVALFGSNWGELTDMMDKDKHPIVRVTEGEKKILGALCNDIKKPDLIHIHITDSYLEPCMGGWRNLGIPICGILNGGDLFTYYNVKPNVRYSSAVGVVSGYWSYKAINLDKYIVRLCNEEWQNLNIKIFGHGWNIPQYLGALQEGEDAVAMASALISPTISEPHSYIFPDVTERTFKTPLTGSLCISDNVDLSEVFPKNLIPQFENYEQFRDLIWYYIKESEKRNILAKQQKEHIKTNHTYFERMSKLLIHLGLNEEAQKLIAKKNVLFPLDI